MLDPFASRWRHLRGGIFALMAAQLAALGHLVGGGGLPPASVVLIAGGLIALAAAGLARQRRGFGWIFGLLLLCQLLFHLLFSLSDPAGHSMAGHRTAAPTGAMATMAAPTPGDSMLLLGGAQMMLFHLVAALLAALLLARGDRALFKLAELYRRVITAVGAPPMLRIKVPIRWSIHRSARVMLPAGPVLDRHPRRGPPAMLAR